MNRRAIIGSLGALLFSAGAAIGVSRLAATKLGKGGTSRLVSLSPAITETLIALGAVHELVAVSNYCVLPPGLRLPRVGSSLTPSFEAIAGLRPSLILSDDSAAAKWRELTALAKCEVLPWLTLDDVVGSIQRLGKLCGQPLAGDAFAQRLKLRLTQRPQAAAPRVLLLLSYDPDRPAELWFIKPNSLHGSALGAAGARNAFEYPVRGLPRIGVEDMLALDPDEVLIMAPPGADVAHKQKMLQAFRALSPLRAVKDDRIAVFTATQSVGPSILDFVDEVAKALKKLSGPRRVGGTIE